MKNRKLFWVDMEFVSELRAQLPHKQVCGTKQQSEMLLIGLQYVNLQRQR